jgi:sugar phosphate isomerase/epimerase
MCSQKGLFLDLKAVRLEETSCTNPPRIGYCTNVHPCRSLDDVGQMLAEQASAVRDQCGFEIAVGLWLPAAAMVDVAADPAAIDRLRGWLAEHRFSCHTLNAFPVGDFHAERVKEQVYLPDWADARRLDYTRACSQLLAEILPAETEGSISTLPLGFKQAERSADFFEQAIAQLLSLAGELGQLRQETGKTVRLAIEPEPFCLLETTAETVAFFERLWQAAAVAGCEAAAREHLGVCYDVCHQAVEFEDADTAVGQLDAAGIRINKVQISCAVELDRPADPEARRALAGFAEARYLHQAFARHADGRIVSAVDLTEQLALDPPADWQAAETWRVHFHVPVDAERLGPLGTTRPELERALTAIQRLTYQPHLEVETYTWPVLPGVTAGDVSAGIARELLATRALLERAAGAA